MSRMNNKFMALLLSEEDADFREVFTSFSEEEQRAFCKQVMEISIWMMRQTDWEEIPSDLLAEMVITLVGSMPIEIRQGYLSEFAKADPTWTYVYDKDNINWNKDAEYNRIFIQVQQNYVNHILKARGYVFLNEVLDQLGIKRVAVGQSVGWSGDQEVEIALAYEVGSDEINLTFNVDEDSWPKICEIMERWHD